MRSSFTVTVLHEGRGLPWARVELAGEGLSLSGYTDSKGEYRVEHLPPGHYSVVSTLQGVIAGGAQCIRVSHRSSWFAGRKLTQVWGEQAQVVHTLEGTITDSVSTSSEPLWKLLRRVEKPGAGVQFTLNGLDGVTLRTAVANEAGKLEWPSVPAGVYVLHVEGGVNGSEFPSIPTVIRFVPSNEARPLRIIRRPGLCGSSDLSIEPTDQAQP